MGRIYDEYRGRFLAVDQQGGIATHRCWVYASPKGGAARTLLNNLSFMAIGGAVAIGNGRGLDVLIASAPPLFPHISGVVAAKVNRVPLVLELRDLWPDYLVGMGILKPGLLRDSLFWLERQLLMAADHVVVVTESFARRMEAKGVAPNRISVIPNGIEPDRYYPAIEPPPVDALSRADGEFIVGYLGNMGAGQGLDAILDAAREVARVDRGIRFVLAGDGPDRGALERRAADLGLPNVEICPSIPKEATRPFYNACDLCLVPLAPVDVFQETVPSKLFEIMACGRPVLACLRGEGEEIVIKGGAGLVAPPGDGPAIARAVLEARGVDREVRRGWGVEAREYVTRHYDRRNLADRYLDVLRQVAGDQV